MGDWFKSLVLFFRDMYRHTVGILTGSLSIVLALFPVLRPSFFIGDQGLLHSKWMWEVAAAISFFFAAHSAWSEQHKARLEIEQKYFDERPKLSFAVHSDEGPEAWDENPNPVTFTVHHLSGRPPTTLYFEPVLSKNGKFSLQFDSLPHIGPGSFNGVGFEVNEIGAHPLSAADRETTNRLRKLLLRDCFLADSPPESVELDYELKVHFKDGQDERSQTFTLIFDRARFRFLMGTATSTPQ